jgi:hypothetical protein
MPAINSTTFNKQNSVGFENPTEPVDLSGEIRLAYAELNTTTQPVNNGDTINLFTLPKGARIVGLQAAYGAMGTGATLTIGDSGSANRYLASTSVAAAGRTDDIALTGLGYILPADTTIVATAGGANYAANRDLKIAVFYVTH